METKRKSEGRPFVCGKMGMTVNTRCDYVVCREFAGEVRRIPIGFDCDRKADCGVESDGVSDWSECVCPDSTR